MRIESVANWLKAIGWLSVVGAFMFCCVHVADATSSVQFRSIPVFYVTLFLGIGIHCASAYVVSQARQKKIAAPRLVLFLMVGGLFGAWVYRLATLLAPMEIHLW